MHCAFNQKLFRKINDRWSCIVSNFNKRFSNRSSHVSPVTHTCPHSLWLVDCTIWSPIKRSYSPNFLGKLNRRSLRFCFKIRYSYSRFYIIKIITGHFLMTSISVFVLSKSVSKISSITLLNFYHIFKPIFFPGLFFDCRIITFIEFGFVGLPLWVCLGLHNQAYTNHYNNDKE